VMLYHQTGIRHDSAEQHGSSYIYRDLMFLGTNNLDPYDRLLFAKKNGGMSSGRVNYDNSIFYQIIPDTEVNNALWYEKERITSLILTDRYINNFKNNLYRRIYNLTNSNIYFRANNWIFKKVFEGTLYEVPPYGELEKIKNFSNPIIKKNYANFQNLHNTIMVISGKFDSEDIKKLINKNFLGIRSSNHSPPAKYTSIFPRTKYVYENWYREKIPQNFTFLGIRAPSKKSFDNLYFNCIRYYLTDKRIAKLNQILNKKYKLNVRINCELTDYFECNAFIIKIYSPQRINLERAKFFVRKTLNDLMGKAISNADLKLIKSLIEIDFAKDMSQLHKRSIRLAENLHIFGDLKFQEDHVQRIQKINVYDIIRIAKRYLRKENRVVLNVYSK